MVCLPGLTLVTLKPWLVSQAGDGGKVLIGGTELRAELSGGEPLVVAGRAGRVHVADELAERGFLGGRCA